MGPASLNASSHLPEPSAKSSHPHFSPFFIGFGLSHSSSVRVCLCWCVCFLVALVIRPRSVLTSEFRLGRPTPRMSSLGVGGWRVLDCSSVLFGLYPVIKGARLKKRMLIENLWGRFCLDYPFILIRYMISPLIHYITLNVLSHDRFFCISMGFLVMSFFLSSH